MTKPNKFSVDEILKQNSDSSCRKASEHPIETDSYISHSNHMNPYNLNFMIAYQKLLESQMNNRGWNNHFILISLLNLLIFIYL